MLDRHWKEMLERMGDSASKPALYGNDYKKVTLQMMLNHNINEFTQDSCKLTLYDVVVFEETMRPIELR